MKYSALSLFSLLCVASAAPQPHTGTGTTLPTTGTRPSPGSKYKMHFVNGTIVPDHLLNHDPSRVVVAPKIPRVPSEVTALDHGCIRDGPNQGWGLVPRDRIQNAIDSAVGEFYSILYGDVFGGIYPHSALTGTTWNIEGLWEIRFTIWNDLDSFLQSSIEAIEFEANWVANNAYIERGLDKDSG